MRRTLILAGLLLLALLAIVVSRTSREPAPEEGRLAWIAAANQLGPVGYRDPAGAISPDGQFMAYTEGRFLRVRPVGGGPAVMFNPGSGQIRHIAWHPRGRLILADGDAEGWMVYDRITGLREPLMPHHPDIARPLRQPAWSPDGGAIAAVVTTSEGAQLWTVQADGGEPRIQKMPVPVSHPAYAPDGRIACIARIDGRPRLTLPCGDVPVRGAADRDAYGPIAFSPSGEDAYVALANDRGTVDLWAVPLTRGAARPLTRFSRDTYAPSVAADGTIVFKVQEYRTTVALAAADGGPTLPLATFQSETPSWHPGGALLGITYGSWRRVVDDAHYPDIAQEAGIIPIDPARPASSVAHVVDASESEDQALCWSPNGKWIAYHSHKEQSDDIWLRPADGSAPAKRISFLGRGAETGWPRWSADGRWLLFNGASKATAGRSAIWIIGIDQASGAIIETPREVALGIDAEAGHAEPLGNGDTIAAVVKSGAGRHAIVTLPRAGGAARIVHAFDSEHDHAGLAASPDGEQVAFVAPAADGYYQVFRMPVAGGAPAQVTRDPSHKTQPAWSPDGRAIAFTVWHYQAQFWARPPR